MSQPATIDRLWSLIRQIQGALGGNRVVRGTVNTTTPTIEQGTGWFVGAKNGTGDVTITFSTPFSAPPTVTVGAASSAARIAGPHTVTKDDARIHGFDAAGGAVECQLHFIAVGPV